MLKEDVDVFRLKAEKEDQINAEQENKKPETTFPDKPDQVILAFQKTG